MKKEMLINVLQPEEIRIAIIEDGVLEELYVERTSHESYVGNIYKGRIVNIEPSIQAAFVDFGVGRNGFLHVSNVEPTYYRHLEERGGRDGDRRGRRERRPANEDRPIANIPTLDEEASAHLADAESVAEERDFNLEPGLDFDGSEPTFLGDVPFSLDEPASAPSVESENADLPIGDGTNAKQEIGVPGLANEEGGAELEEAPGETPGGEGEGRGRGRRRGRGRGRGRGRRPQSDEQAPVESSREQSAVAGPSSSPASEFSGVTHPSQEAGPSSAPPSESSGTTPPSQEAGPSSVPPSESSQFPPPSDDRPFPMGSADHRTDDHSHSSPSQPIGPPDFNDEDLSFSMARSEAKPGHEEHVHRPEPEQREPEQREPEQREPEQREPEQRQPEQREPEQREPEQHEPVRSEAPGHEQSPREPTPADISLDPVDFLPDQMPPLREPTDDVRQERAPNFGGDDFEPRPRHRRGPGDDQREDHRGGRRGDRRSGPGRGGRSAPGRGGFARGGNGRAGFGRPKPLIQDIFKRGQEVLVQVIKEGIGTKGPTLSTYISIAGRYLVLMPGLNRIGVSRKIDDEESRRRLRNVLHELQPPRGLGFIIRTAGLDRNKKELQRDLAYLSRLWQVVARRITKIKSPAEIYQESDMITRTIRDIFTSEIDTIWVDEKNAFDHAQEFMQVVMPRYASRIKHYDSSEPMFHKYGIESEMDRIQRRHVPLPAGGSIVIDQTEALVAIDVNSGNFRADNNAEETAYQMNLQAAREIARQLRLRDLGGVIVNDFIDMRDEKHRRGVEKVLRDAIKRDRARTKVLRISQFGIIEMTRQRIRPSLKRSVFQDCPHCHSTGQIKTVESMSIDVMRLLQLAAHREIIQRIEARVHEEVAHYLLNRKRAEIARLEEAGGKQFFIQGKASVSPEFLEMTCYDNNNNEVKFAPYEEPPARSPRRRG